VPTRPAGYTGDGLTGRLWNTTSCLTVAPLTHSHVQLGIPETGSRADSGMPPAASRPLHSLTHTPSWVYRRRAHGPTLECHQLPHGSSTHSLTRPAGYTGDGSRVDSGTPPAASRPLHSLTHSLTHGVERRGESSGTYMSMVLPAPTPPCMYSPRMVRLASSTDRVDAAALHCPPPSAHCNQRAKPIAELIIPLYNKEISRSYSRPPKLRLR
jgi:hypothetical protein